MAKQLGTAVVAQIASEDYGDETRSFVKGLLDVGGAAVAPVANHRPAANAPAFNPLAPGMRVLTHEELASITGESAKTYPNQLPERLAEKIATAQSKYRKFQWQNGFIKELS